MKKFFSKLGLLTMTMTMLGFTYFPMSSSAAFNANIIMDDTVFNTPSMNAAQIDAFLNSFPSSCISTNNGFSSENVVGYNPSQGFIYGSAVSAGTVIFNASSAYDINPQVILATLQKEQSLVSGGAGCHYETPATQNPCPNPPYGTSTTCVSACQYSGGCVYIAMGYDCPQYCVPNSTGFSKQIIKAAWKLKFVQQRSLGNYSWNVQKPGWDNSDDPTTSYNGYMTQGLLKRNASSDPQNYDGYRPVNNNSLTVHLGAGATASLYSYTPFTSGNTNFVNIFENWFGGTISSTYYSCRGYNNIASAGTGVRILPNKFSYYDKLALTQLNDTSTACIEVHTWSDTNFNIWLQHVASNSGAISPADSRLLTADGNGDGRDELVLINYQNTGSGMIEAHVWNSNYQGWIAHVATNRVAINPADAEVIVGDLNGDGRDESYLVQYQNTGSGMIEVHGWSGSLTSWASHTATNRVAINPADAEVIAGDANGDGRDELYLVQYRNTSSGMIEVHGWSGNQQQWVSHTATNRPAIDPGTRANPYASIIMADTNADGRDEFILTEYHGTGSGRVEVHIWSANLQQWVKHAATSQGSY